METKSIKINKIYKLNKKREQEEKKRIADLNKRWEKKLQKFKDMIEKKKIKDQNKLKASIDKKYEKKIREIEWKKPLKKHQKKEKTKAQLMKKLYKYVQLYARLRDSDKTWYWYCISSGRRIHYKKWDGWHYLSRRFMMFAFDPDNIHLQSKKDNQAMSWVYGMEIANETLAKYRENLIKKIGKKKVEYMEANKNKIRDWKRSEIIEMIKNFKEACKRLEAEKE